MTAGRFKIDPDPPVAGQPATITYTGTERAIDWQVNGHPRITEEVPPRVIRIPSVPSGEVLVVSDNTGGEDGAQEFPIAEMG